MKTLNYSRQRQAIWDFLCTRRDHPTADIIYRNVRSAFPNISLGTVYRNLNLLADLGMIRKVKGLNDTEHFDGDTSPHQHFICRKCGAVQDIFLKNEDLLRSMNIAAGKNFDGQIIENDIYFYGKCSRCFAAQT